MKYQITVLPDEHSFDEAAALRIVEQIKSKPNCVIGLSTGRTTGNMHRLVAQLWQQTGFDVSRTTFFGLDEVVGVPREYAGACYTMLRTEVLDAMKVDEEHFLMLPTESDDFPAACQHFTDELEQRGGIDHILGREDGRASAACLSWVWERTAIWALTSQELHSAVLPG